MLYKIHLHNFHKDTFKFSQHLLFINPKTHEGVKYGSISDSLNYKDKV